MTLQEIVEQLPKLTVAERRALRDAVERSLREAKPTPAERAEAIRGLKGMAKPDAPIPPEWDAREGYIDYLVKKYS
ncbi:MAG TPA: hypothetical protein VKV26_19920 [Dehalococcoidia bacterium]|nr:hypothetical protein [Dehalococcoidia bacterium]